MSNDFALQKTEDGSYTLYTPEFQENTHSIHGAYSEALYKHLYPSEILKRYDKELIVLDIGFGLGYNILALITEIKKMDISSLKVFSFEKERAIEPFLNSLSFKDERDEGLALLKRAFNTGKAVDKNIEIQVLFGDARAAIQTLNPLIGQVAAVFQDPHSPGKNSELWSVEFFKQLYSLMDNQSRLTTYSFASQVRMGLIEAGFNVMPYLSDKISKEGTIASKNRLKGQIEGDELENLKNDIKSTPYHDDHELTLDREVIRLQRVEEMAERRAIRKIAL